MDKDFVINQLNSTKLPELKQLAKLMEVKHTGRKLELKERLLEQLNSKKGLKKAQEYFMKTHPLPTTLNPGAATETENDTNDNNGAKSKTGNKEQQLQEADESELGEPEVFPGLAGYYLATFTAGRIVLKITGKDIDWIKVGRFIGVCPCCDKTQNGQKATTMPAPIEDEPTAEENYFFDVVFGQNRLRIHGPTVEIVKAARYYLCGYFQHVKEVKHLPA